MLLRLHSVHSHDSPGQVLSVLAAFLKEHSDGDGGKLVDEVTESLAEASKPLVHLSQCWAASISSSDISSVLPL